VPKRIKLIAAGQMVDTALLNDRHRALSPVCPVEDGMQ